MSPPATLDSAPGPRSAAPVREQGAKWPNEPDHHLLGGTSPGGTVSPTNTQSTTPPPSDEPNNGPRNQESAVDIRINCAHGDLTASSTTPPWLVTSPGCFRSRSSCPTSTPPRRSPTSPASSTPPPHRRDRCHRRRHHLLRPVRQPRALLPRRCLRRRTGPTRPARRRRSICPLPAARPHPGHDRDRAQLTRRPRKPAAAQPGATQARPKRTPAVGVVGDGE